MPNPQQPELARARRSDAVSDDALPSKAANRSRKKGAVADAGPVPEENQPGHQPEVVPDKPLVPHDAYRLRAVDDDRGDDDGGTVDDAFEGDTSVRYEFAFDTLMRPFAAAVGVLPNTAWLRLDDDELEIRFGPWSLRTPRSNVVGCEVTGPYHPVKVVGGPHVSLADRGITFATSRRLGACIRFRQPVPALDPLGLVKHPAATVTITNPHDLARRLGSSGERD